MVIAVDFDGTLCKNEYPLIGRANIRLIASLKKNKAKGDTLILWTCREGEILEQAISWCASFGLEFDYVNENTPELIKRYGNDTRKIGADLYIDDKGVKPYW